MLRLVVPAAARICGVLIVVCCAGYITSRAIGASHAETAAADQPLVARGIVRAGVDAVISTELTATVSALTFKPGDSFAAGDILVRFDCSRYVAERQASMAELRTARLEVTSNETLLRHKAVGVVEVEISRAKRDQMAARLEALMVRERQCAIPAPFAGRVVERHVQLHEMSKPNGPLMQIVNRTLEIDLIVPSSWSNWLTLDAEFRFQVEETQAILDAHVARIGAVVDPVSRTMRVTGRITETIQRVLPGMSGTATFQRPKG